MTGWEMGCHDPNPLHKVNNNGQKSPLTWETFFWTQEKAYHRLGSEDHVTKYSMKPVIPVFPLCFTKLILRARNESLKKKKKNKNDQLWTKRFTTVLTL